MIKDFTSDNDIFYHEFSNDIPRERLAIVMHGFPGRNKHLDLAEAIFATGRYDVVVPHNLGIGKTQGPFSFYKSVEAPLNFIQEWQFHPYKKITLIGLSWGGLIVLNAFKEIILEKRGKLVLVCPYSSFRETQREKDIVRDFIDDTPELFLDKEFEDVWEDLRQVKAAFDPRQVLKEPWLNPSSVKIIQGSLDQRVLPEETTRLAQLISEETEIITLEDDHKFTANRELMIQTIIAQLD